MYVRNVLCSMLRLWLTRWLWRVAHIGQKSKKANALISNARAIITTSFRTETTACYAVVDVVVVVVIVVVSGGVVNGTAAIVVVVVAVVVTVEQRKIEYRSARASLDSTHTHTHTPYKWIMCLGESRTGEARVIFLFALSNILHSHHALYTRHTSSNLITVATAYYKDYCFFFSFSSSIVVVHLALSFDALLYAVCHERVHTISLLRVFGTVCSWNSMNFSFVWRTESQAWSVVFVLFVQFWRRLCGCYLLLLITWPLNAIGWIIILSFFCMTHVRTASSLSLISVVALCRV